VLLLLLLLAPGAGEDRPLGPTGIRQRGVGTGTEVPLAKLCPRWRASSVRSGLGSAPSPQAVMAALPLHQLKRLGSPARAWEGQSMAFPPPAGLGPAVAGDTSVPWGTALQLRTRIRLAQPWLLSDSSNPVPSLAAGRKSENPRTGPSDAGAAAAASSSPPPRAEGPF